jgi:hypothetical protein
VTTLIDATFDEMDEAVFTFGQRLGERGGVGLFYYAGHGVEAGGANYLVPVEQAIRAERELRYKAISVDRVLDEITHGWTPGCRRGDRRGRSMTCPPAPQANSPRLPGPRDRSRESGRVQL